MYTVESSDEEEEATQEAEEENAEGKGDEVDAEPGTSGAAGGPPKEKSQYSNNSIDLNSSPCYIKTNAHMFFFLYSHFRTCKYYYETTLPVRSVEDEV